MKAQLLQEKALQEVVIDVVSHHCLPVNNYVDYWVSTLGEVISFKGKKPRVLKPRIIHGYCYVALSAKDEEAPKQIRVHRLVAQTFLGAPSVDRESNDKDQVNHLDCDKKNNKVSNLEWTSSKENLAHFRLIKNLNMLPDMA